MEMSIGNAPPEISSPPRDLLPQSAWTDLAAALATSTILKSNLPSKAPTYGGLQRVRWYSLQLLRHNPDYGAPTMMMHQLWCTNYHTATMMHQLLVPTMHPPCFSLLLFLHQLWFRWKWSNLLPQWFLQNSVQMQRKEQNHLVVLGRSISAIYPRRVVLGQSIWVTFPWEL